MIYLTKAEREMNDAEKYEVRSDVLWDQEEYSIYRKSDGAYIQTYYTFEAAQRQCDRMNKE